jgi:uncharacterized protein YdcH (DUF465 family)
MKNTYIITLFYSLFFQCNSSAPTTIISNSNLSPAISIESPILDLYLAYKIEEDNLTKTNKVKFARDPVKLLADLKLTKNEAEFCKLLELANSLEDKIVTNALAHQFALSQTFTAPKYQESLSKSSLNLLKKYLFIETQKLFKKNHVELMKPDPTLEIIFDDLVYMPGIIEFINSKLDLSGFGLRDLAYFNFIKKMDIEQLDLSNNLLEEVPDCLDNFPNLKSLDLSNNKLKQLPRSIGKLKHLEKLVLKNNLLTNLTEEIGGLIQLTYLDASENKIEIIPTSLANCQSLRWLYLNNNKLKSISSAIENLVNLERLNIYGNPLQNLNFDRQKLTKLRIVK